MTMLNGKTSHLIIGLLVILIAVVIGVYAKLEYDNAALRQEIEEAKQKPAEQPIVEPVKEEPPAPVPTPTPTPTPTPSPTPIPEPETPPEPETDGTVPLGQTFQIKIGQTFLITTGGAESESVGTITLNAINDSRCKPEVVCIWQGELTAEFKTINTQTGKTEVFNVGTVRETCGNTAIGSVRVGDMTLQAATISIQQSCN